MRQSCRPLSLVLLFDFVQPLTRRGFSATAVTPAWQQQFRRMSERQQPQRSYPKDISSLAEYILSDDCRSVAVLSGAGISVASGIPDFRSPGGMYDTLRPELITATPQERQLMAMDPTYVVSWDIFQRNQFPYLEVRRPFILGTRERKWKATLGHWFFDLLEQKTKNKLTRLYTQNIDGLFYQLDHIPRDKIVDVHGSLGVVCCESCGYEMPFDQFCDKVRSNIKDLYGIDEDAPSESTNIACPSCRRPTIKPNTVLFGRNLPTDFFEKSQEDMPGTDLLLIVGTSLVVSPANSLIFRASESAARVLINREPAGQAQASQSATHRDLFLQGDCDEVLLQLAQALGWKDDVEALVDKLPPISAALLQQG